MHEQLEHDGVVVGPRQYLLLDGFDGCDRVSKGSTNLCVGFIGNPCQLA
jgi:hypothetical protein